MHAVYRKPAGGVLVLAFTMLFDARSDPLAVPPAHDVLACGLAVLYSPFTSDPDRDGRRHRVLPGAFVESFASGAAISFTDESCDVPIELGGQWRFVNVAAGVRLGVLDTKIVKTPGKGGPFGLTSKWHADEW